MVHKKWFVALFASMILSSVNVYAERSICNAAYCHEQHCPDCYRVDPHLKKSYLSTPPHETNDERFELKKAYCSVAKANSRLNRSCDTYGCIIQPRLSDC